VKINPKEDLLQNTQASWSPKRRVEGAIRVGPGRAARDRTRSKSDENAEGRGSFWRTMDNNKDVREGRNEV